MKEFIFINDKTTDRDMDSVLCPTNEEIVSLSDIKDMADIWVKVGLFPSRTQAIKNNHGGEIPSGFTHLNKRKRGIDIVIWNPVD